MERRLIAVVGPTASGKSHLVLRLAAAWDGEIVNYDSVQVYRYFNIGSGKLTPAERRGIPHHLIDFVEPDQLFTAGEFGRAGRNVLLEIASRNRIPILAGGTGFYLRALLEGLPPSHERDDSVRASLLQRHARRPGSLHRILRRLDAQAAARIHPNDIRKVVRALELCLLHRKPASALLSEAKHGLEGFVIQKIGLNPPRPELYERINARVRHMFEAGLIEEVQGILSRGVPVTTKPFESLGYAQVREYLQGKISVQEAIRLTQDETRRYAKRQMTWFRRETGVDWFAGFGDEAALQNQVLELLRG